MLPVEIRRVTTRAERAAFVRMAWRIYAQDPLWVPPLIGDQMEFIDPARGVFFRHGEAELFLAYRGDRPVGRISAHVNRRHDERFGGAKGFIGFFECEEDPGTAGWLFNAAENWLRSRGRTEAEGPMSFGVYDELGILVDGFTTPPYLMTVHNPPYYGGLFEACGWEKAVDWYGFRGRKGVTDEQLDPRYARLAEKVVSRAGITFRPMDIRGSLDREAGIVKAIFADAWDGNWGHVPFSEGEFERLKKALASTVVAPLSLVAEQEGKPIGFTLSLYDANVAVRKVNGRLFPFGFLTLLREIPRTARFRLILMGVTRAYRGKGIEAALYTKVIEEGIRLGFTEVETSMIVETNEAMMSSIGRLQVERYKTWRIFRKDLTV
jgi:GNAT superfamily N-acetyltransferase